MEKIKFITDSASDISTEQEAKYNIKVLNFKITLGDKGFTSRVDITNEQFYELLEQSPDIPTTAQLTIFEFIDLFTETYREGCTHAIVTLINKDASSTYANAETAIEQFYGENPDAKDAFKIILIDSRSYTGGYGYAVTEGAKMAAAGKSAEEIEAFMRDWIAHLTIFFAPYSLKYARKSGRIPGATAVVGEALGIKPIMRIYDHKIENDEMIRGEKKLVGKIADKTVAEMIEGTPYCVVYGSNPKDGEDMAAAMTERLGVPPAEVYQAGAIITAHAGPRVVGVILQSKKAH